MGKERERTRIKSRVDELPEEIKKLLDDLLLDVNITYQEIADAITQKGYEISKSSVGRYALRKNAVLNRLKEATEQTKMIIEASKGNDPLKAVNATVEMMTAGLARKIATAQEEIDNMPVGKAMSTTIQLKRVAVEEVNALLRSDRLYRKALEDVKAAFIKVLKKKPGLIEEIEKAAKEVEKELDKKLEQKLEGKLNE